MFLVGTSTEKVVNGKVKLPKEFHLKKKMLLYKWKDDSTLVLSDEEKPLDFVAGKGNMAERMRTDSFSCIRVRPELEGWEANIEGQISIVTIHFEKSSGV